MVTTTVKRPPVVVLLVEDNPGDQLITQEALKTLRVPCDLRLARDGAEALDFLFRRGPYENPPAPQPDLILLDLNMPRVSGQEVARQVRADPRLQRVPVVVLTTSRRDDDVLGAYGQGVLYFITKPLDFERFLATIKDLEHVIKLMAAIKGLRNQSHITDRQIYRVARRSRQLTQMAEALFERRIRDIERGLSSALGDVAESQHTAQQSLIRLAEKLLDKAGRRS